MRLAAALLSLGERPLRTFCEQRGVSVDAGKRLPVAEQAARKLLTPSSLRTIDAWPEPVRRAAAQLAAHRDGVPRAELSGGGLSLLESGLAFVVPTSPNRLMMPAEYRLQIPRTPVDAPRALRVLLPHLDQETVHALSGPLGIRLGTSARLFTLAEILEALEPEPAIQRSLRSLPPRQARLLAAIEARGDELSTDELLELEQDPARYVGAPLPRRSASYELLRRGLLLPVGAGVFGLPAEVADVVSRRRRAESEKERGVAARRIRAADRLPRRAVYGLDPSPSVVVLLASLRAQGVVLRPSAGAPRSAVARAARAAAVDPEAAGLLVSLARAGGLLDSTAPVDSLAPTLFDAWRRTGAWDESREPADGYRAGSRLAHVASPIRSLRDVLLELLEALPGEAFTPLEEVLRVASRDLRFASASTVLARARRAAPQAFVDRPEAALRAMLTVSLPALGMLDRGGDEEGTLVRLSSLGRRLLSGTSLPTRARSPAPVWVGEARFRLDPSASLREVLAVAEVADAFRSESEVFFEVSRASLARSLDRGASAEDARLAIERLLGSLDEGTRRLLADVDRVRATCTMVPASAYIAFTDGELKARVLADPEAAEILVPGPDEGFLVRPDVAVPSVRRLFRRHGIEVESPGKSRKD